MAKSWSICLIALLLAIQIAAQKRPAKVTAPRKQESRQIGVTQQVPRPLKLQILDDGHQFTITNAGTSAIGDLKITSYPEPLTMNILFLAYSFSKQAGTLEPGESIIVRRDEMVNTKGAKLSNSKLHVGTILINGKIAGQPQGNIFTSESGKWILSPPTIQWSGVKEPMLGPIEEPLRSLLKVDLYHGKKEHLYIIVNKEKTAIQELTLTAYPLPVRGSTLDAKKSFHKIIETLQLSDMIVVKADEMKNDQGEPLSEAKMRVGVVHLSGNVNGEIKEIFITIKEKAGK